MIYIYILIFILSIIIVILYLKLINLKKIINKESNNTNIIEATNKDSKRRFNNNYPDINILSDSEYKSFINKFNKDNNEYIITLGYNKNNEIETIDLDNISNILVLGTTGGGKSVILNSIISSIVELSSFNNIPHYVKETISDMNDASNELEEISKEINERKHQDNIKEYLKVIIDDLYDLSYEQELYISNLLEELLEDSKNTKVHFILATDTPNNKVLKDNLLRLLPSKFYLTISPGTYKEFNIDNNLNNEDLDYIATIGNMIYLENNNKKRIKVVEIPSQNLKEIVEYYSV